MNVFSISGDDVVTFLIFVGVTLLAIRGLAWNQVKALLSKGWATVHGTVEFGTVEAHRVRYFTYYVTRLDYSYPVNGEYYSGYLERSFLRESSADRFLDTMKGQMVFVRSNPRHPERSALLKSDQPAGWVGMRS